MMTLVLFEGKFTDVYFYIECFRNLDLGSLGRLFYLVGQSVMVMVL